MNDNERKQLIDDLILEVEHRDSLKETLSHIQGYIEESNKRINEIRKELEEDSSDLFGYTIGKAKDQTPEN